MIKEINSVSDLIIEKERKQIGNVTIYNITEKEQYNEIYKIIEENSKIIQQNNETVLDTDIKDIKLFRYLLEELTSISDIIKSMTDEKFIEVLSKPSSIFKPILKEIAEIIKEVSDDFIYNMNNQVDLMYNSVVLQSDSMEKMNEIASKMGMSLDELVSISQDQKKIDELKARLEEENNKKKLEAIPQDHLPKQEKKKRGRKKKVVEEKSTEELERQIAEEEAKLEELKSMVATENVDVIK